MNCVNEHGLCLSEPHVTDLDGQWHEPLPPPTPRPLLILWDLSPDAHLWSQPALLEKPLWQAS